MRLKKSVLPVVCFLLLASCANRTPRVGAISIVDSDVYDALLISEGIITSAEKQKADSTLTPQMREAINKLIPVHNSVTVAWRIYRSQSSGATREEKEAELRMLIPGLVAAISGVTILVTGGE
jgi:type IV pilus biogenesis protein CpaD/CtpE